MKAIDLAPEKRFIGMFVGKSGSGKTPAACSFPGPVEVLEFDGNIQSLLACPWVPREPIEYTYFPPKQKGILDAIDKKLDMYDTAYKLGQPIPRTIVVDSVTNETFALVCQAMSITHKEGGKGESKKGKFLGALAMPGPEDYGFEAQGTYGLVASLLSLPCNIILIAHVVDRYGKSDESDPYSASVVIGEKISLRDKISENLPTKMQHIFRFNKSEVAGRTKFTVKFHSDLAKTSWPLPFGEIDITGKNFYNDVLMPLIHPEKVVTENA